MKTIIEPNSSLIGEIEVPGDKSISHRAIMLSALCPGESVIDNLNLGEDVMNTLKFIQDLGTVSAVNGNRLNVQGGFSGLHASSNSIWAGNSGTLVRLGAGIATYFPQDTIFVGDNSLSKRPMKRLVEPLSQMGATINGDGKNFTLPLTVSGGRLKGITYVLPVPSAQVKSAIMFASLSAISPTEIVETAMTRVHSEELFKLVGIDLEVSRNGNEHRIYIEPSMPQIPLVIKVPGDPSQAAFFLVGAVVSKQSTVIAKNLYIGRERTGFISVLERMGGRVMIEKSPEGYLPVAKVEARSSKLNSVEVLPDEIPTLIDEIPILAIAAMAAEGVSIFRSVSELRIKESDRVESIIGLVKSFGGRANATNDDLYVTGGFDRSNDPVYVDAKLDHRIAMAAAVGSVMTSRIVEIDGFDGVATSYTNFLEDFKCLNKT